MDTNENTIIQNALMSNMKKVSDDTNLLFDILVKNQKQNDNVLPEHIFVQYFLPYFTGKYSLEDNPKVMLDWLSIAGNPNAGVNIIDGSRKVLFHVPHLFNTNKLDPLADSKTLRNIGNEFDLYNGSFQTAGLAQQIAIKNYQNKIKDIVRPDADDSEEAREWRYIYERYNIPLISAIAKKEEPKSDFDEINYD